MDDEPFFDENVENNFDEDDMDSVDWMNYIVLHTPENAEDLDSF